MYIYIYICTYIYAPIRPAREIVRELKSQALDAIMLQANIRIRPDTARGVDVEVSRLYIYMFKCIFICVYVCIYMSEYICIYKSICLFTCVCIYVLVHIYVYVYLKCIHLYIYTLMIPTFASFPTLCVVLMLRCNRCVDIYTYIYICIYIYVYICLYVYVAYIYIYIYLYMYM